MRNKSGQFLKGHKCPLEYKIKKSVTLKKSWVNRSAYHGMYGTKFYNSWRSMITRCNGTAGKGSIKKYKNKGITYCERWADFKNFHYDMYETYTEGLQIDRINNGLGYTFENCRWVTSKQNNNNRTNNVRIDYKGENKTLSEWADTFNIPYQRLKLRYYNFYLKNKYDLNYLFRT